MQIQKCQLSLNGQTNLSLKERYKHISDCRFFLAERLFKKRGSFSSFFVLKNSCSASFLSLDKAMLTLGIGPSATALTKFDCHL